MSLHTWHHQGPCKPSSYPPSHSTLTGAELPQANKSCIYAHRVTSVVSYNLCDPVDCVLPGFSVREGGSPGKNTGAYWPILAAIPF